MFSKFPTFLQSFQQVFQNMFSKTQVMFTFSQNFSKDEMLRGRADNQEMITNTGVDPE